MGSIREEKLPVMTRKGAYHRAMTLNNMKAGVGGGGGGGGVGGKERKQGREGVLTRDWLASSKHSLVSKAHSAASRACIATPIFFPGRCRLSGFCCPYSQQALTYFGPSLSRNTSTDTEKCSSLTAPQRSCVLD